MQRHDFLGAAAGDGFEIGLNENPPENNCRPAADVLFRSVAAHMGGNVLAVIMTGMGDDGARGMAEMKDAGATNYAQDEDSCVVFGMPKEAIKLGAVDEIMPLDRVADAILRFDARG